MCHVRARDPAGTMLYILKKAGLEVRAIIVSTQLVAHVLLIIPCMEIKTFNARKPKCPLIVDWSSPSVGRSALPTLNYHDCNDINRVTEALISLPKLAAAEVLFSNVVYCSILFLFGNNCLNIN
jgi:hypothetical protein